MNRIKQKSRANRQKKRMQTHKRSVMAVIAVIVMLSVVVTANGMSLREKEKAYEAQVSELEKEISQEKARASEIDELEQYVGTDEYIEEVAREKLGLVYKNEIIFKAK